MIYLWIKWVHYLGFVSWMAALFYLPRLFVYHAQNMNNEGFVRVVKVQERRLFWAISTPAMIITLASGAALLGLGGAALLRGAGFMHVKFLLVAGLLFYQYSNYRFIRSFAAGRCPRNEGFFRKYNELPTLLFALIALLMILRPF